MASAEVQSKPAALAHGSHNALDRLKYALDAELLAEGVNENETQAAQRNNGGSQAETLNGDHRTTNYGTEEVNHALPVTQENPSAAEAPSAAGPTDELQLEKAPTPTGDNNDPVGDKNTTTTQPNEEGNTVAAPPNLDIPGDEEDDFRSMVGDEVRGARSDWDEFFTLKHRRKEAQKRLLQHTSYAVLMEDRIERLEEDLSKLRHIIPKKYNWEDESVSSEDEVRDSDEPEPTITPHDLQKAMQLKSARMSWAEFILNPEDRERDRKAAVIELCTERPTSNLFAFSRRRQRKTSSRTADSQSSSRVERIRINSSYLCDVLVEVLTKDLAPLKGQMMVRPFKALFTNREELIGAKEELIKRHEECLSWMSKPAKETSSLQSLPKEDGEAALDSQVAHNNGATSAAADESNNSTSILEVGDGTGTAKEAVESKSVSEQNGMTTGTDSLGQDTSTERPSERPTYADCDCGVCLDKLKEEVEMRKLKVDHLQVLLDMMENDLKEETIIHQKCRAGKIKTIRFEDLWHLYVPGGVLFYPQRQQAYRLLAVHNGREILQVEDISAERQGRDLLSSAQRSRKTELVLDYFNIDFDGERFGPTRFHIKIEPFEGEKQVTDLDLYPVEYGTTRATSNISRALTTPTLNESLPLFGALLERGRRFKELANARHVDHCEYRGMTLDRNPEMVDSHVIVDTSFYYESHAPQTPLLGLSNITGGDCREVEEFCHRCEYIGRPSSTTCELHQYTKIYDDRKIEEDRTRACIEDHLGWLRDSAHGDLQFKDEHLVLLPGRLWSYVLYSRDWHRLDVNKIRRVTEWTESFKQLQIDPLYRTLVESQVTMHSKGVKPATSTVGASEIDRRDDLVRGKGKGLIILLHGAPGVGKTSTAECVAEFTRRPLLSITCGDIGDSAAAVEKELGHYLNLAHRWGCVLLLDEADVYLSRRDTRDMKRNAVVSVFLRILEYYSGILFLTTNKVGTVDEAFKSRIHLSLFYPPLSLDQTRAIWGINLDRIQKNKPHVTFDKQEIFDWASDHWRSLKRRRTVVWNGRQIRNACQTIAALAEFDNDNKITKDHLRSVEKASHEFDRYLRDIHGGDESDRAKKAKDRRDDFDSAYFNQQPSSRDHYGYGYDDEYEDYDSRENYDQYGSRDHRDDYQDSWRGSARDRRPSLRPRTRTDHYSPPHDGRRENDRREPDRRQAPRERDAWDGHETESRRDRERDRDREAMPPPPRVSERHERRESQAGRSDSRRVEGRRSGRPESASRGDDRGYESDRRR